MESQTRDNESVQPTEVTEVPKTDETNTSAESPADSGQSTDTVKEDMSQYQTFAILGYIIPFLFFLPLLDDKIKQVPYVRFHANQQMILLVVIFGSYILHSFLFGMMMILGYYVAQILNLAIIVLAIIGIFNAYKGQMKELPLIGRFRLLK